MTVLAIGVAWGSDGGHLAAAGMATLRRVTTYDGRVLPSHSSQVDRAEHLADGL